ncbi:MAG: hypothetical protein J6S38_05205 [Erysipelotrichaceae bacterium]|nr:hypothetical protein [Erysipelotrichaceae bacterium]
MNFNAPKKTTWFIGLALVVVALAVHFFLGANDVDFWVAFVAACLMLFATYATQI